MGIGAELNSLIFWINAFIPDPSMSPFVIPAPGKPEGRSMIVVPAQLGNTPVPTFRSFLGDNRNFSDDVTAASRIHSLVEIADLDIFVPTFGAASMCGESIEIDGNSGVEIAKGTASTDRIRFLNLRGNTTVDPNGGVIEDSPSPNFVQLDYEAAANLPLAAFSPDIDMVGVLGIDRDGGTFRFRGAVDGFPAFEAYVSFNGGPAATLFRLPPVAPILLIGDVTRPVDVTIPIDT